MAHYMHGSFETVGEAFLKNVTLWWGCAWTLAVYVTQVGSLAMIVIGLCYVVLARDGAMTSITEAERMAPALCAGGIIAEVVAGLPAITPSSRSGRTSTTARCGREYGSGSGFKPSASRSTSPASCTRTAASNAPCMC